MEKQGKGILKTCIIFVLVYCIMLLQFGSIKPASAKEIAEKKIDANFDAEEQRAKELKEKGIDPNYEDKVCFDQCKMTKHFDETYDDNDDDEDDVIFDGRAFYPLFEKHDYKEKEVIEIKFDWSSAEKPLNLSCNTEGFSVVKSPYFIKDDKISVSVVSIAGVTEHYIEVIATFNDGSVKRSEAFGITTDKGLYLAGGSYDAAWDIYYSTKTEKSENVKKSGTTKNAKTIAESEISLNDGKISERDISLNERSIAENEISRDRKISEHIGSQYYSERFKNVEKETASVIAPIGSTKASASSTKSSTKGSASLPRSSSGNTVVSGYLGWIDDYNVEHPLGLVRVDVFDDARAVCVGTTYTDLGGHYSLEYGDNLIRDLLILVFPETEYSQVKTGTGSRYCFASSTYYGVIPGSELTIDWNVTMYSTLGQAFQISQMLVAYEQFYRRLAFFDFPEMSQLTAYYPHVENTSSSFYNRSEKALYLIGFISNDPDIVNSYAAWDVVTHMCGHHLMYELKINAGTEESSEFYANLADYYNDKKKGIDTAWREGMATVLGQLLQVRTEMSLFTIHTCRDNVYVDYEGNSIEMETAYGQSEAVEATVIGLMWDLLDDALISHCEQEEFDEFAWGFTICLRLQDSKARTLSHFVEYLCSTLHSTELRKFLKLIDHYGLSPSDVTADTSGFFPTISWNAGGTSSYLYYDSFELVFLNSLEQEVLRITDIRSHTYTLSFNEWRTVLYSQGINAYFMVVAHQTDYPQTGNYPSLVATFLKQPEDQTEYLYLYDDVYYKEVVDYIIPGSSIDCFVHCDVPGRRLIQTFGWWGDSTLSVYDADNNLLAYDDDSGYKRNALIQIYLQANVQYRIHFEYLYQLGENARIVIIPTQGESEKSGGLIEEYEDILHIGEDGNIGLPLVQYFSRTFLFVPEITNEYSFDLNSGFDSVFFFLDPRNNTPYNIYNECTGMYTTSAHLTKMLEENIPYFIVVAQNHPRDPISPGEEVFSFSITKRKVPPVSTVPEYLRLRLLSGSGFIFMTWQFELINVNDFAVQVSYNSKTLLGLDATTYGEVFDLVTINIPAKDSRVVTIGTRPFGQWVTMAIEYEYESAAYRRITCTRGMTTYPCLSVFEPEFYEVPYVEKKVYNF